MIIYLAIYSTNIHQNLEFYKILGCDFIQEQHEKGPVHYTLKLDQIEIKLYPINKRGTPSNVTIGLDIKDKQALLELQQKGYEIRKIGESKYQTVDPDNRRILIHVSSQ